MSFTVPKEVSRVTSALKKAGYESYLVGGCVRDLILERKPKDWDVTTNATPEQIIAIFPKTFYENTYGTVGVVDEETTDETIKVVQVTPYRLEAGYSDNRRPDSVTFSETLEDDLKRRDFTINAIAYNAEKDVIVDMYNGREDIEKKTIRTVGNPDERFQEDGLRIMRAVRFFAELGFMIEKETADALARNAHLLKNIAIERIRDEFVRILMSDRPMEAIVFSHKFGILQYIVPELEDAIGVKQTQAHSYDVWEHLLRTVQHAADKKWPLHVRMAALLHDISKPETKRMGDKQEPTFYGHEVVGARTTAKILKRLKFPTDFIETVTKLVRWHMFFSDTEQITLSAVRRLVSNVGKDMIWDLINIRICDRVGTGRPKENPYRLRKYKSMIEEALRDPVSVGMLKIDGNGIVEATKINPGPKIGYILHALFEEVLEDPKKNTEEYLKERARKLSMLPETELKALGEEGKEKKDEEEQKELDEIRKRHWVK